MTLVELFYFDVKKLFKITTQFLTLNMMTGYQLIILEFYLDPKICNRWDLPLFSYESQLSNWAIMQQQGVRRVNIFTAWLFNPLESWSLWRTWGGVVGLSNGNVWSILTQIQLRLNMKSIWMTGKNQIKSSKYIPSHLNLNMKDHRPKSWTGGFYYFDDDLTISYILNE